MSEKNRIVWMDIPVEDLSRATKFYSHLMGLEFSIQEHGGMKFSLCPHSDNESAFCLVIEPNFKPCDINHHAPLIYLNVEGRMDQAVKNATEYGGKIIKAKEQIGPYGFRAILLDSEGNCIALHSIKG